jgi:hypothetical protein
MASILAQSLADMRNQLGDLSTQLSTGQKSTTYAGLGLASGLSVGLQNQLSQMSSYDTSMQVVSTQLNVAQTTLNRLSAIGDEVKSNANLANFNPDQTGQTSAQTVAYTDLSEYLGLLNTQVGNRYIFSGRDATTSPVADINTILNGNGSQAGLKQLTSERNQADLGSDGMGRLVMGQPSSSSVSLTEDAANSPFGFKIQSGSSTDANATVSVAGGSPNSISIDLGATNPNPGDVIKVQLGLPDGSSETISLTATTASPAGANQFTIGADTTETATNLQSSLTTAVQGLAGSSLAAASTLAASNDFFNIDDTHPPQRVDGPPFDTATQLVDGTPANTVSWYQGDGGSDPARSTAAAKIDPSITVAYGMRANEQGIRFVLQNVAALAVSTFPPSDPNSVARAAAMRSRLTTNLGTPPGTQSIQDIETELAGTQNSIKNAQDRHAQVSQTLDDLLQQTTGVSSEQVGVQLMTLQTRMQASMQTTAMLYQMSLVNFLKA